jgi:hypothetical protein
MKLPDLVKKPILGVYGKAIALNLALQGHDYQYVFVLAHMRSGSTLLSHILANNPDFDGAGESHLTYKTPADLSKLAIATCQRQRTLKLKPGAKYLVDQINYNEFLTDETLSSPLIHKCVFLIRPPEPTFESMISRFKWPEKVAFDYYVDRLKTLVKYSQLLKENALLIEYDDLVDHSEQTLAALTNFLGAREPFKPSFEADKTTARSADPSDNMWHGRIVRTQPHKIGISAEVLSQATTAFQQCREQLLRSGVKPANEASLSLAAQAVS